MSGEGLGPLAPPDWLSEHPAIRSRGIELTIPLKPFSVWRTDIDRYTPPYAVKIVPAGTAEAEIYEQLHRLSPASPNHTLPCDVIHAESGQSFLIMPCLQTIHLRVANASGRWGLLHLLDLFYQVIEGIEFLHERNIAHMDMYDGQVIIASERHVAFHKEVEAGKAYIIDFDRSKRLKKGPGFQQAIDLPETNCKPPLGMTRFDPYSWDVYCTGILFKFVTKYNYDRHVPWIVRRYIAWLVGKERGCTTICRCRPSARRARQVLGVIQLAARIWERCAACVSSVFSLCKPQAESDSSRT